MTVKKTVMFMTCMAIVFVLQTAPARETVKYKDKQIEELSSKFFYYSNADGKEALTLTAATWKDLNAFATDCCQNTLAKLGAESQALSIPGTSLILAFLDCPITNDVYHDSVVAFFDRNNMNVPICISQLDLMPAGEYFYGSVRSLEARKNRKGGFYVVVTLAGADGGDYWTSYLLLHIEMNCTTTVLSKLYASHGMNHDAENPGRDIAYRFVDDETVEITTYHLALTDKRDEEVVKRTSERFNLEDLYDNPQLRVFPSQAEKSLVLLKSGVDPNSRDENGKTLFMWIAEGLSSRVVKARLNKEVDINAKSKDGYTVLMSAAHGGDPELVTLLLDKGADVNAKDNNGWTALMSAARIGSWQSVEVLLNKGADINAKTNCGRTALMAACNKATVEHQQIVKLLIERGADVNAKDREGGTALMAATRVGCKKIIELLRAHGATE